MRKITKRIMAFMLSLVMMLGFIPNNISYASSYVYAKINLKTNRILGGYTPSDIKFLDSECSIAFGEEGTIPCDIKPEILGVSKIAGAEGDLNQFLLPDDFKLLGNDLYFLFFKYDLSSVDPTSTLGEYLLTSDEIELTEDSSFGRLPIEGEEASDVIHPVSDRRFSMYSYDFEYSNDRKECIAFAQIVPETTSNAKAVTTFNTEPLTFTENSFSLTCTGEELPVYLEAKLYPGDYLEDQLGGKLYDTLITYPTRDVRVLNPSITDRSKIGDASISANRKYGVYQFKCQNALTPGQTYTLKLSYRTTAEFATQMDSYELMHITMPQDTTKEVACFAYNICEPFSSIPDDFYDIDDEDLLAPLYEATEMEELKYTYFTVYSIEGEEDEDEPTYDKDDYVYVFNGRVLVPCDDEGGMITEFINGNSIVLDSDCLIFYILEDFTLAEPISEENHYAVKFTDAATMDFYPYSYQWMKYEEIEPKNVDINILDTNRSVLADLNKKVIYKDADEKYFVYSNDDNLETLESSDFSSGILGTSSGMFQYAGKIGIYSDELMDGDIVTLFAASDLFNAHINDVNGAAFDKNKDNGTTSLKIKEEYIKDVNGKKYIEIYWNSLMTNCSITSINISNGSSYRNVPGETKSYIQNPEDGKYICNIYYFVRNMFETFTDIVDVKALPKETTHKTKKYKATDSKDTTEKITGSGKKGSTRTIVPEEGRKVASVKVVDKNGNEIPVTMNEDGTYSFEQPASNVDVLVSYKNREITLNIGSTEASVDGERSNLDVAPVIRNDRTMLPIRFVAENLGAKVEWSEKNPNYVVITRGATKIEITLGSDIMKVNGKD
ncbi:MAG: copper amine oxidase N-terminal domain-containing protein, partial [Clostridia bacterium]|nr:copper amine oxidase N-terminal domain-containing protein [Clostridia bacterium]